MKKIIHVNKQTIQKNNKYGTCDPPITCKTYKSNDYTHSVEITAPDGTVVAKVVHRPEKPLSCGAKVWIEIVDGDWNIK